MALVNPDSLAITELLERVLRSEGEVGTVERLAKLLQGSEYPEQRHLGYCLCDALVQHEEVYGDEAD